jgi:predicted  nucleic acid-binding Zn-ribbon protein
MRTIEEISKDLSGISEDIKTKKETLDRANEAASKANKELETTKIRAGELSREMQEYLNLLVPESQHGRVRQNG